MFDDWLGMDTTSGYVDYNMNFDPNGTLNFDGNYEVNNNDTWHYDMDYDYLNAYFEKEWQSIISNTALYCHMNFTLIHPYPPTGRNS